MCVFGPSKQLSLNKFFDPSIPSMRKVDDGKKEKRKKKKKEKKRIMFLVATTSLPAVYRPNGYARTTTTGTPHARANSINILFSHNLSSVVLKTYLWLSLF